MVREHGIRDRGISLSAAALRKVIRLYTREAGIREKVLAAYRFGLKRILLPKENEKDLAEIPSEIRGELEFFLVEQMDEVLVQAFTAPPSSLGLGQRPEEESRGEGPADEPVAH